MKQAWPHLHNGIGDDHERAGAASPSVHDGDDRAATGAAGRGSGCRIQARSPHTHHRLVVPEYYAAVGCELVEALQVIPEKNTLSNSVCNGHRAPYSTNKAWDCHLRMLGPCPCPQTQAHSEAACWSSPPLAGSHDPGCDLPMQTPRRFTIGNMSTATNQSHSEVRMTLQAGHQLSLPRPCRISR
jgi:hypothetical protein